MDKESYEKVKEKALQFKLPQLTAKSMDKVTAEYGFHVTTIKVGLTIPTQEASELHSEVEKAYSSPFTIVWTADVLPMPTEGKKTETGRTIASSLSASNESSKEQTGRIKRCTLHKVD